MSKYIKLRFFTQLRCLEPERLWAMQSSKSKLVYFRGKNQIFKALSYSWESHSIFGGRRVSM